MKLRQGTRELIRVQEIARILVRHGFGFAAERLARVWGLPRRLFRKKPLPPAPEHSTWEHLRLALTELGPTFIKLGQLLSTRGDLLPADLLRELEKLQDEVEPFPFEEALEQIGSELGRRPEEVFAQIDEVPLAAASLGQVHRAKLASGEDVVVKIQRPGIERVVEVDLEILLDGAALAERQFQAARALGVRDLALEFAQGIRKELDYRHEASSCTRLGEHFKVSETVHIPRIYWDYTTRRLLVMERVEGIKANDTSSIEARGWDRERIARVIVRAMMEQILRFGIFHADLHPGNVVVLDEGKIAFIDFGLVGETSPRMRKYGAGMILGLLRKDSRRIASAVLALSHMREDLDRDKFEADIDRIIERYGKLSLAELRLSEFLPDVLGACSENGVRLPGNFALLIRALVTLEGLLGILVPGANAIELMKSCGGDLLREEAFRGRLGSISEDVLEYARELIQLPRELQGLARQLLRGKIRFRHEAPELTRVGKMLQVAVNRLALSIVVAGILVGSALIAQVHPRIAIFGLPLAELGFTVAIFFGVWLLIATFRSGRF